MNVEKYSVYTEPTTLQTIMITQQDRSKFTCYALKGNMSFILNEMTYPAQKESRNVLRSR